MKKKTLKKNIEKAGIKTTSDFEVLRESLKGATKPRAAAPAVCDPPGICVQYDVRS